MNTIEKDGKEYIAISQNGLRNAMDYVKDSECEPKDVTERIKTFEDAYNELGDEHPFVCAYDALITHEELDDQEDIVAYLKLRIICAALNEGWEPRFTKNEYRYYTYFMLYSEKDVEGMDDKTKNELGLFGCTAYYGPCCGFVAAYALSGSGGANATVGSRLCLRTRELAVYCGRQFIDLWKDYYIETAK